MSLKQKLNSNSSTTAELVAVHQALPMVTWVPLFLEEQGYPIEENIIYQDNQSTMLLEQNEKKSSCKRTRHLNIRFFMVTNQVKKGNIVIKYCPTDIKVGDYIKKGLQEIKLTKFCKGILGFFEMLRRTKWNRIE